MQFRSGQKSHDLRLDREPPDHRSKSWSIASGVSVFALAFSLGGTQSALSADAPLVVQEQEVVEQARNWVLQITPYMWAAGLKGNISPFQRGPTIGIEKSFSDVLDDLNFGGFLNIWGRYERFVFSGDIMYVSTSDGHSVGNLPSFTIPGVGVIPAGGNADAVVDSKQFTATAMAGYRIVDAPQFTLDALGGVRFWHISNDVTINGSLGPNSESVSYGESFGWADPLLGLRAFLSLTDKLSIQAQADIGGFGAGSDFTWSAMATVNYRVTEHLFASLGYKVLDVNYNHGGHVYDTRLSGPVLGVTYRF